MNTVRIKLLWPILGAFTLLASAALLIGETFITGRINSEMVQQYQTELSRELGLGGELLSQDADADPDSLASFISQRIGYRVSIVDAEGRVLGDSEIPRGDLPEVENHADRPEIQYAVANPGEVGFASRRSETVGVRLLYGAQRIQLPGRWLVLRIAVPVDAIDAVVTRMRDWIFGVGILGLATSVVVALLLGLRLTRPLNEVTEGARRLAEGDLSTRIQAKSGFSEVDRLAVTFNRLAMELQARLEELARERDDMQALIDSLDEGIIALTDDARILRTNGAALELLGIGEPPPFAPIGSLIPDADLRELMESAVVAPIEATEVHLRGRYLIVASQILERGGAVVTILDVTEIRRLEKVRSDFVANASHELKTPLTSMRGFAETLLEDDPPAELRREFLGAIRNNTVRLQRLVDDLLDLSRLESGGWRAREEEVEVREVAEEVWSEAFERRAEDLKIRFRVEGEALVLADERALGQIFRNLFDNALRHSPEGGSITVQIRPRGPTADVAVADTGSGIAPTLLHRIFERFFRADPARSRAAGGTGLGLAIVRHMVQAMGGEIWAESEVGVGTSIHFTLPFIGSSEHSAEKS